MFIKFLRLLTKLEEIAASLKAWIEIQAVCYAGRDILRTPSTYKVLFKIL